MRWFDRSFELGVPARLFANIVERLRGTPARLEELVGAITPAVYTISRNGTWSIQENVGHLLDLEPLWAGRVEDLFGGSEVLREADLENRKTHDAGHNTRRMPDLLADFRAERGSLVLRLGALAPADMTASALHPRLRQPMTVVDLAFFVAEHDDHHLARITELRNEPRKEAT